MVGRRADMATTARDWFQSFEIYLERRVIAILLLGFSSGLPIMLVGFTLSAWLREEGLSRSAIGLFGLVFAPYTLKFIWAPLMDRMPLPPFTTLMGRRRGWILFTQLALIAAIIGLGRTEPGIDVWWTAFFAVLVAFFSASQDVVIDAYRIDSLPREELGAGAGVVVLGYRIAMWVATAGALFLAERAGWSAAYTAMALLMGVGILTVLLVPEPDRSTTALIDRDALAQDQLAQDAASKKFERYQGLGGSLVLIVALLLLVQPLSLLFGIVSPYHGAWTALAGIAALGNAALTGSGVLVGWKLLRRDAASPIYGKWFALGGVIWLLTEVALYALPAGGFLGQLYGWLVMVLVWAVSSPVIALVTGSGLAFEQVVTPDWVFLTSLWLKFSSFVWLYGFFYFGARAIANFGVTPLAEEAVAHLWMRRALIEPFYDFFKRAGITTALVILALVSVFKASDAVLTLMANPFYIDVGFTKDQIAWVSATFGLWMTLLGGLLGGVIVYRLGMLRSLILAAVIMGVSNASFALLALSAEETLGIAEAAIAANRELSEAEIQFRTEATSGWLYALFHLVLVIENLSGGIGTAVFVAFLSSLCNVAYSAFQYALLTSFMQMLAKFVIVPSSGFYADALGWLGFFMTSTLFAVPALLLIAWLHRYGPDLASLDPDSEPQAQSA
ncbi:MAG: MFS transporter [Geminicoccaceae bacterium]